ncbi:hypothetical protein [Vibrio sp. CK2-1]|uniref:hypothetical protein n=1 Tax=Vibrio sp. CK2-1 TaxID=2912249 RepID=UPI001F23F0F3|nr:hypothetical protein [Vibrio sp. CK2-1]MCF7354764.1 hypothetical protein [Vibrio sp. CK2-1]
MDKRSVHFISYPDSSLARIAAHLLHQQSASLYDISFEVLDDELESEGMELERFDYFGYSFLDPTSELEPAYDYVVDINYAMYRCQKRREAYFKNIYWEVGCNKSATQVLQDNVNFFVSRFNIVA